MKITRKNILASDDSLPKYLRYKGYTVILDRGGDGYNVYNRDHELEDEGFWSLDSAKEFIDTICCSSKIVAEESVEDDELEATEQEFTSKDTSINSTKLPAIYSLVNFPKESFVVDYGGGKFDNAMKYLESIDCEGRVYDPYNRDSEYNRETVRLCKSHGGADIGLCSNVLNVIKEPKARKLVLTNMKKLVKPNGDIYITVYEGSGTGEGKQSQKDSYQLNRKTADYLEEIQEVFPDAKRKGKLIHATNSGAVQSSQKIDASHKTKFWDNVESEIYSIVESYIEPGTDPDDYPDLVEVHLAETLSGFIVQVWIDLSDEELKSLRERLEKYLRRYDPTFEFEPSDDWTLEGFIVDTKADDLQSIDSSYITRNPNYCPHCTNMTLVEVEDGYYICEECGEEYTGHPAYEGGLKLTSIESACKIEASIISENDLKVLMKAAINVDSWESLGDVISSLQSIDKSLYLKYSEMEKLKEYSPAAIGKMISDDLYWKVDSTETIKSSTILDQPAPYQIAEVCKEIQDDIYNAASDIMQSEEFGFPLEEIADYLVVEVTPEYEDSKKKKLDRIKVEVRAELDYEGMSMLAEALDPVVQAQDPDAYFDHLTGGIIDAYIYYPTGKIPMYNVDSSCTIKAALVDAPQHVVDSLLEILSEYGFELETRFKTNPGRTWMDNIHLQVINNDVQTDESHLRLYVPREMIDKIHDLEESSNCPITWNFGIDDDNHVTGGLNIDKQWIPDEDIESSCNIQSSKHIYQVDIGGWETASIEANSPEEALEICKRDYLDEDDLEELEADPHYIWIRDDVEASYGGAYDIEDDQYFTKEELVEFGENITEVLPGNYELESIYVTKEKSGLNHLEISVTDDENTLEADVYLDMRKIRRPDDIYKYFTILVSRLEDLHNEYHIGDEFEAVTSAVEPSLDPPEEPEPEEFKETYEVEFDDIVIVKENAIEFEESNFEDIYETDYNGMSISLKIDDGEDVAEKIIELVDYNVPEDPGKYRISGVAHLTYEVNNIYAGSVDRDEYGEADIEYVTEDADIEYDFRSSWIENLQVEKIEEK